MKIRNWEKFQHYKYRNPPWIKLYRDLLNDPDWFELSGESAKGLMMLWLIASEADGYLPASNVLAFRLHISENRITSLLSDCSKWLEDDASNVLASCKQDAIPEYRDRVQSTEKELEQEKIKIARAKPFLDEFELDADMIVFANERGVDPVEEFARFSDHHKAKGTRFVNWKSAWRTWVRRAPEFKGRSNGSRKLTGNALTEANLKAAGFLPRN